MGGEKPRRCISRKTKEEKEKKKIKGKVCPSAGGDKENRTFS